MCTPAAIPWILGAVGIAVVKKQSDDAIRSMNNAQSAALAAAPKAPAIPTAPKSIAAGEPLKDVDAQTASARAEQKRKAQALAGIGNTIKTSGLGLPGPAPVQGKTLLGQ